jgi:DNA (cytosine-5)-methyltransferase 1
MPAFYEFFAGGGMVRQALQPGWTCLWASDVDPKKARAYRDNWGAAEFSLRDVRRVRASELPGRADLAWGSFPCQDLSLAGLGAGLAGARSGTFGAFWAVIDALAEDGRAPPVVAVENVCGTLTSRGGGDFSTILRAFAERGYRAGALVIDAARFGPQSRPRLFVIGVRGAVSEALLDQPGAFHPPALRRAVAQAGAPHLWWRLPEPDQAPRTLESVLEDPPTGVRWHRPEETARLLSLMTPVNLEKVAAARRAGGRSIGFVYRRTRPDAAGASRQRAEVRFDGRAGCLRTPAGGSSRQVVMLVEDGVVRTRLLSPREAAALMGLPPAYRLPENYNDAYHLLGDGVVAPVVAHLARHLLEPLLKSLFHDRRAA